MRERREDIPLLAHHFVERLSHELGKDLADISEGGLKRLLNHDWPGNVREMENAVERAIVTSKSRILAEEDFAFVNHDHPGESWDVPPQMTLEQIENQVITTTLHRTHGNIKEAASILGVDRSTLYDRLKKYNLPRNQ